MLVCVLSFRAHIRLLVSGFWISFFSFCFLFCFCFLGVLANRYKSSQERCIIFVLGSEGRTWRHVRWCDVLPMAGWRCPPVALASSRANNTKQLMPRFAPVESLTVWRMQTVLIRCPSLVSSHHLFACNWNGWRVILQSKSYLTKTEIDPKLHVLKDVPVSFQSSLRYFHHSIILVC